jgi:hypothetical protein
VPELVRARAQRFLVVGRDDLARRAVDVGEYAVGRAFAERGDLGDLERTEARRKRGLQLVGDRLPANSSIECSSNAARTAAYASSLAATSASPTPRTSAKKPGPSGITSIVFPLSDAHASLCYHRLHKATTVDTECRASARLAQHAQCVARRENLATERAVRR